MSTVHQGMVSQSPQKSAIEKRKATIQRKKDELAAKEALEVLEAAAADPAPDPDISRPVASNEEEAPVEVVADDDGYARYESVQQEPHRFDLLLGPGDRIRGAYDGAAMKVRFRIPKDLVERAERHQFIRHGRLVRV